MIVKLTDTANSTKPLTTQDNFKEDYKIYSQWFILEKYHAHKVKELESLKCYYDENTLLSFSVDPDFIFRKNAPCQLLRLDFSFKMSVITRFCSSRVALRELDRERK